MIEALRGWLTGVVAVSALLFLVRSLAPKGTVGAVAEFTGGLLLLLALLRPLGDLGWEVDLSALEEEMAVRQEELEAHRQAVIEAEIEAYRSSMTERQVSNDGEN